MALRWLKRYRLTGKNARSVLGMVCLLAWLVPVESWAQGSLWDDLKAVATQVVRDKIKAVPTTVSTPPPSPQSASQPVSTSGDARTLTEARPVENNLGVGFRSTRDFVLEPSTVKRNVDNSLDFKIRVFNLSEADGVLEVFDESGKLTEFPKAILGNRRIPDSVYALVIDNQVKVGRGLYEYVMKGQSPLDPRSRFQSRETELSLTVPPGGSFRITKASPYAIAYSFLFFGLEHVGYTDPDGSTISQRRMQDIVKTLAEEFGPFIAERLATRTLTYPDLLDFGCELTLKLVGTVLKPQNLDGRTLLGSALKEHLADATPFVSQLKTAAKLGDAANWVNTLANIRAARIQDTSIVINRGEDRSSDAATAATKQPSTPSATQVPSSQADTVYTGDNEKPGLSGDEVAKALGSTREHDRAAAIAKMVKQGAIRSPLTANELALILKGTTGGNRRYSIAQLGALMKSRLTAPEAATVLGTVNELREQDRAAAIQSIAKANAYAGLAGDAALILEGTTGGHRSFAIAELANFFKKGLSASAVSEALGTVQQLREQDRAAAIRALVSASVPGLWGGEASEPLNGCTGGHRSYAIAQLAPRLRAGLTGTEIASILGRPEELREQDRAAAIRSVVDARRLRLPLSGDELERVLTGTTGGHRSYAIGLLTQRR